MNFYCFSIALNKLIMKITKKQQPNIIQCDLKYIKCSFGCL